MSATAAHLTDRVLPEVPIRQWVLSVPFALRRVLARDPAALTLVSRAFWEELRRWLREASHLTPGDDERIETGAITFVQRFGGSLNLNVHLHVVVADGVWRCTTDGRSPSFVPTPPPTRDDLLRVVTCVVRRLARAFERRATAGDHGRDDEGEDALAGCFRAALARGTYGAAGGGAAEGSDDAEQRFGRRPPKAQVAEVDGFNLHASVVLGARDGVGRERLMRYVARPAVVNERVTGLPDGRVAYRLKHCGGRGETHRIMEPMEFMARLAALVPPPRHPLVRYHGVFAPNSPWRGAVVPAAPASQERVCATPRPRPAAAENPRSAAAEATRPADPRHVDADVFSVPEVAVPTKPPRATTRIDWATLLHRVWGVDALQCPRCEGRMKFIATITERAVIVRILAHLRLPTEEVLPAPARRWDDTS
jgi:cell division septation protein DedD